MKVICGNVNPKGNVALTFKGGCGKELDIQDAYRCTGCGGWFHRDCIFEHFELEEGHSTAHNALKKIRDLCDKGLDREKQDTKISDLCKDCRSRGSKIYCKTGIKMIGNKKYCKFRQIIRK